MRLAAFVVYLNVKGQNYRQALGPVGHEGMSMWIELGRNKARRQTRRELDAQRRELIPSNYY